MAAANENGDGKTDIVLGLFAKNAPGSVPASPPSWKQPKAFTGRMRPRCQTRASTGLLYPAIGAFRDFNGDGKLDLMFTNLQRSSTGSYPRPDAYPRLAREQEIRAPQTFSVGSTGGPSAVAPFKTRRAPNVFLVNNLSSSSGTFLYYLSRTKASNRSSARRFLKRQNLGAQSVPRFGDWETTKPIDRVAVRDCASRRRIFDSLVQYIDVRTG